MNAEEDFIKPTIHRKRKRRVWDESADPNQVSNVKKSVIDISKVKSSAIRVPKDSSFRRVYVGSINYMITQELIMALFKPFGTILKAEMPKDSVSGASKGFCFLEFAQEQDALESLACLNGFSISGRPIKVGAPAGYAAPDVDYAQIFAQPHVQEKFDQVCETAVHLGLFTSRENAVTDPTLGGSGASRSVVTNPDVTVYVGSVEYQYTAEDIRSLFDPFGEIADVNMIMNPETGKHRGYCFVAYKTREAAVAAIAAMHGVTLGDRSLIVSHVTKQNTMMLNAGPVTDLTTSILLLKNIISAEAYEEEDKEMFRQEMFEELQIYGKVEDLVIHVEQGDVCIFVRYGSNDAAAKAKIELSAREFDGKHVVAMFATEQDMQK